MTPRVSVLIPTWDREAYLAAAVVSVLDQTWRDFELIVVDDGSTDGTAQMMRRFAAVRYIRQPHGGIPAARNRALAAARGEMIAWLDADDLYAPAKLEKQVTYLDAHPACQLVFCLPLSFSDLDYARMTPRQRKIMDLNGTEYAGCLPTACIRREVFARYGGFDTRYACAEDTEWLARICAAGVDIGHCLRERLYLRRVHDSQISYTCPELRRPQYLKIYADAIRHAGGKGGEPC